MEVENGNKRGIYLLCKEGGTKERSPEEALYSSFANRLWKLK